MAVNLFDANFYRSVNPDLASFNDAQAYQHLISNGLNEGRKFSQYVDLNVYRANNLDLAAAGLTTNQQLYDHLSAIGAAEGRTFSPVFNANVYRALNADLQAAGLNNEQLFDHFRAFGINEGRQASNSFSVGFYLAANPDLQAAGFNNQQALQHYVFLGIAEGRAAVPGGGTTPPPPPPPAEPGSTPDTALNIGILNGTFRYNDFVGIGDRIDFYRFSLDNVKDVDVLVEKEDGALIYLYFDENNNNQVEDGEIISQDSKLGNSDLSISRTLGKGNYFIKITNGTESSIFSDDRITSTRYNFILSTDGTITTQNSNSIDILTNSSTVNELPASTDFGNVAFNDADVSVIQEFGGNGAVELGNVASNQLPNTTQDLIGDALGIGADFGSGFNSNLLDNANFNSTLNLL
jgi:hypothetical protein